MEPGRYRYRDEYLRQSNRLRSIQEYRRYKEGERRKKYLLISGGILTVILLIWQIAS